MTNIIVEGIVNFLSVDSKIAKAKKIIFNLKIYLKTLKYKKYLSTPTFSTQSLFK